MKPLEKAVAEMLRIPQFVAWVVAVVLVLVGLLWSSNDFVPLYAASALALFTASTLPVAILSPSDRSIASLFHQALRLQAQRWTRISADEPITFDEAESRRWMQSHPVDLEDRDSIGFHGAFLLRLKDYDAAEDLARRMPVETPSQRFDQAISLAQVDFERGGDGDLTASAQLLGEIPEGADRHRALRDYAFEETSRELSLDGDWRAPLIALNRQNARSGIMTILPLGVARLGSVTPRFFLGWMITIIAFAIATSVDAI